MSDNPILTVVGLKKSEGDFEKDGKKLNFSNTVVTVLQQFTDDEVLKGAIGLKSTEYKIKGAQFFDNYKHMKDKLPCDAELIFHVDVSKKVATLNLVGLKFLEKKNV